MKRRVLLFIPIVLASLRPALSAEPTPAVIRRQIREIEGWTVQIRDELLASKLKSATEHALELLTAQLKEINRVAPAAAVAKLHEVTLWISPEYPGIEPRAEYHPDAAWLRDNNRDPAMAKGVEFTDVRTFKRDSKRMPWFVLHELAHAYHDQVLPRGFDNPEIKEVYERAKASGVYDRVEQRLGDGRSIHARAYAMTNPMEYFAESSEAFFGVNDFFPFTRDELAKNDPLMCELLRKLWGEAAQPK